MKIAVCVKYVPVVSRIRFDYENKVIQRKGRLRKSIPLTCWASTWPLT